MLDKIPSRASGTLMCCGDALIAISAWPGRIGSALILLLIFVVLLSVTGSLLGWSALLSWDTAIPLFGTHLNMTSIGELQWHVFALLVALSGAYALKESRHVRVDIISGRFSTRTKLWIDVVGDLIFLVPFFCLLAYYSMDLIHTAYEFSERSNSGGLQDRYLVKSTLLLTSVLLVMAGTGRILKNIGLLLKP
ncbi:TRAP transporter small permease subunit [Castellaniella sp. WN]